MIYLASDHAGFDLKEGLKAPLERRNAFFEDLGCFSKKSCNYPEYAHELARRILADENSLGIAVCGTGIGMSIVLNRHFGIRAARCLFAEDATLSRQHNDANGLVLAGRQTGLDEAVLILDAFLDTKFEGGRHIDRIRKIEIF